MTDTLPRRLPIVTIARIGESPVRYFRDDRLREFRAVSNPHQRMSFDEVDDEIHDGTIHDDGQCFVNDEGR